MLGQGASWRRRIDRGLQFRTYKYQFSSSKWVWRRFSASKRQYSKTVWLQNYCFPIDIFPPIIHTFLQPWKIQRLHNNILGIHGIPCFSFHNPIQKRIPRQCGSDHFPSINKSLFEFQGRARPNIWRLLPWIFWGRLGRWAGRETNCETHPWTKDLRVLRCTIYWNLVFDF